MKLSSRLQCLFGVGLLLLSISHWFPLGINLLELLSAFAHFSFVLALLVTLITAIFRLYILSVLSLVSGLICGILVVPHFTSMETAEEADFIIGQFNLYHNNSTSEQAIIELSNQNADIFTIQELSNDWSVFTDSILEFSHPYTIEAPWDSCCYGIGLYSKFPIASYEVLDLANTPTIIAHVVIENEDVTVVSLHTRPPAFPNETETRNRQLQAIAEIVSRENGPCLVIGDFNVVPWDSEFKKFLEQAKLLAARDGFQATYPMDLGIPLIPIDYITYSKGLVPASIETISIPRSDHKGLVGSFRFVN